MLKQSLSVVRPFGIVASMGQPPGPIPPVPTAELYFAQSISLMRPSSFLYANDAQLYRAASTALLEMLLDGMVASVGAHLGL